jgi:hypothetical protein
MIVKLAIQFEVDDVPAIPRHVIVKALAEQFHLGGDVYFSVADDDGGMHNLTATAQDAEEITDEFEDRARQLFWRLFGRDGTNLSEGASVRAIMDFAEAERKR